MIIYGYKPFAPVNGPQVFSNGTHSWWLTQKKTCCSQHRYSKLPVSVRPRDQIHIAGLAIRVKWTARKCSKCRLFKHAQTTLTVVQVSWSLDLGDIICACAKDELDDRVTNWISSLVPPVITSNWWNSVAGSLVITIGFKSLKLSKVACGSGHSHGRAHAGDVRWLESPLLWMWPGTIQSFWDSIYI